MSDLNWQVNCSSTFALFFIVMTHNPPVKFKLIYFQLLTKESRQSPNFETFKCSSENLPNSSCYFPNYKFVFFQILHDCLVSWKITFLGSKFAEKTKQSATVETFEGSDQNSPNFCHFWDNISVFLQIRLSILSAIKHNSSELSNLNHYILWSKAAH